MLAGGQVHHRVAAPADRPDQLLDLLGDAGTDRAVADVGVDLGQEIAADDHRLAFRVVDVVGQDRAAAGDLVADEFGCDGLLDAGAEGLPRVLLAQHLVAHRFEALVLADRDVLHLRRDDAAPRVVHLADVGAGLCHAWQPPVGEAHRVQPPVALTAAAATGPQLAHRSGVSAFTDPPPPQRRTASRP